MRNDELRRAQAALLNQRGGKGACGHPATEERSNRWVEQNAGSFRLDKTGALVDHIFKRGLPPKQHGNVSRRSSCSSGGYASPEKRVVSTTRPCVSAHRDASQTGPHTLRPLLFTFGNGGQEGVWQSDAVEGGIVFSGNGICWVEKGGSGCGASCRPDHAW